MNKEILKQVLEMHGVGRKEITKRFNISESDARAMCAIRDNQDVVFATVTAPRKKILVPKEHKAYVRKICRNQTLSHSEKLELLSENLKVNHENVEQWVSAMGLSLMPTQFFKAKNRKIKKSKRYIISSAQTASMVHTEFLKNIEAYAKFIGAEIGIIATRYRNPTSIWKESGDVWSLEVDKYLTAKRQVLHPRLVLLADLKIQATAPNPTRSTELFGDDKTCIVGAPKIEMHPLSSLKEQHQKFIYSTGSVTAPSFTDTVAGGKAAEHHSYGFIVVEIENDEIVHVRSVSAQKDGCFNDLKYKISNQTITEEDIEYLIWGDSHFAQKNQNVTNAFRDICKDLGIRKSVLHDVFDSESMNTHNMKDPVIQHELQQAGRDDFRRELNHMYSELDWFEENMDQVLVVASNHDDMVDRAMIKGDWRDNLKNALIFVEMLTLKLNKKAEDGLIPYYINKRYEKVRALSLDDSFIYKGVELALHGHKGPNGSRGNISQFAKLSVRTIIGHSHSPKIKGGCYQVGISCDMDHGYNKGLSSWGYASCTLNKYGKRQMILLNKKSLTYTTLY
jgi:transposase